MFEEFLNIYNIDRFNYVQTKVSTKKRNTHMQKLTSSMLVTQFISTFSSTSQTPTLWTSGSLCWFGHVHYKPLWDATAMWALFLVQRVEQTRCLRRWKPVYPVSILSRNVLESLCNILIGSLKQAVITKCYILFVMHSEPRIPRGFLN